MDKPTETLDLSKIRKGLQIEDEELLNKYLKEIWSDLSKRSVEENAKGINKKVEIENIKEKIVGNLVGVDEQGALIIEQNGQQMRILTGDVHYL